MIDRNSTNVPLAAFGGASDEHVPLEKLALWRDQTSGPFSIHVFPGDHYFLHSCEMAVMNAVRGELLGGS